MEPGKLHMRKELKTISSDGPDNSDAVLHRETPRLGLCITAGSRALARQGRCNPNLNYGHHDCALVEEDL